MLLTLLFNLFACTQSEVIEEIQTENEFEEATDFVFSAPYILDIFPSTEKVIDTNKMLTPFNQLIYIGSLLDTINLRSLTQNRYESYWNNSTNKDSLSINQGLKLYISEQQILSIPKSHFFAFEPTVTTIQEEGSVLAIPSAYSLIEADKNNADNYIQSIPVFIINTSRDIIFLAHQDEAIMMIQEAKDENGLWRPIEFWRYSFCGNSYGTMGISPNDGVLVKIYKYSGDFETAIRLKLKNGDNVIYSDSFRGKINQTQFNPPNQEDEWGFRDSTSWFY